MAVEVVSGIFVARTVLAPFVQFRWDICGPIWSGRFSLDDFEGRSV